MSGTAPFDWDTAKKALHTWLSGQLGITVRWQDQDIPRPAYPYATLAILAGPRRTGSLDENRWEDQAGGSGVRVAVVGDREITVSCQTYVSFEGAAYDHDTDASARLAIAEASLGMDDVHAALRVAGLSVRDIMPVRPVGGIGEASFISRAVLDFTCGLGYRVVPDAGAYGQSIGTVRVSSTLSGQAGAENLDLDDEEMGET